MRISGKGGRERNAVILIFMPDLIPFFSRKKKFFLVVMHTHS